MVAVGAIAEGTNVGESPMDCEGVRETSASVPDQAASAMETTSGPICRDDVGPSESTTDTDPYPDSADVMAGEDEFDDLNTAMDAQDWSVLASVAEI